MNIEWLKNKGKEKFYPVTNTKAVLHGDSNKTLDEELDSIAVAIDNKISKEGDIESENIIPKKSFTYNIGSKEKPYSALYGKYYTVRSKENQNKSVATLMYDDDPNPITGDTVNKVPTGKVILGNDLGEEDENTATGVITMCNLKGKYTNIRPDESVEKTTNLYLPKFTGTIGLKEFNPNAKLDLRRIYRNNIVSGTSASMSPDVNKPSWAQGICVTGTEIIYSLSNLTNVSNNTKLIKLNKFTLELISETILELGHANSLSYDYDNNEIYCSECYNTSGSSKRIFVIDNETMTIKRTITVDTTGTDLASISWVYYCNDNNTIYVGSGSSNVTYKLNSDYTLTAVATTSTSYNSGSTLQTRKVKNKRVYSLYYNPSTITITDIMTGKVSEVRNISESFDRYQVGEVEDFDFDEDGNIYMLSHVNYEGQALYTHQIFIGNMDTGYISKIPCTSNSQDPDVIYVDQSVSSINPDGTKDNPFYELCEAVNYIKYMDKKPKQIYIASGEHEFTFINNLSTILNFKNSSSVRGLIIQNSIITLNDIIMKKGNYKSALNIYENSHVIVNNITFNGISNASGGLIYNKCNDLTINGDVTKVDCTCSYDINNSSYWKVKLANSNASIHNGASVNCYIASDVGAAPTVHTHTVSNIPDLTATASEINVLDGITATTTELNYVDGVTSNIQTQLNSKLSISLKGSASGLAELDSNGRVPSSQLPSFVDDVVEGYLSGGKFYKESAHTTEISGETGKIYIDLHTEKTYRWSGSTFVVISETLALGETSSTAYRGDRGKTAYDHSQSAHARTDATKVEASTTNGNIKINGTEITVYTHPSGTNPHGTTKSDVGLSNVENFKAVSTVASQGLTDTEKSNARDNIGAGTSNFSGDYNDLSNKPSLNYLPLTGGTLSNTSLNVFTLKRASTSGAFITFQNNSGNLGYIGVNGSGQPYFLLGSNPSNAYRLLDDRDLALIETRLSALESK